MGGNSLVDGGVRAAENGEGSEEGGDLHDECSE
jgi:hypothetical protein